MLAVTAHAAGSDAEAQHIAKRLAAWAVADGRNLLLDVTMGSQPSVLSWPVNLGLAAYTVDVVIIRISGQDAVRWADVEHRRGHDEYVYGRCNGGRYVPQKRSFLRPRSLSRLRAATGRRSCGMSAASRTSRSPPGSCLAWPATISTTGLRSRISGGTCAPAS